MKSRLPKRHSFRCIRVFPVTFMKEAQPSLSPQKNLNELFASSPIKQRWLRRWSGPRSLSWKNEGYDKRLVNKPNACVRRARDQCGDSRGTRSLWTHDPVTVGEWWLFIRSGAMNAGEDGVIPQQEVSRARWISSLFSTRFLFRSFAQRRETVFQLIVELI